MLSESHFRGLISGRQQGPVATSIRASLRLLELVYARIIERRNRRFDRGIERPHRVSAPVISIGNLTVGGTGKTPFVGWLAQWLLDRGTAVTIISRGYGAPRGQPNDEALELAARLPGVPHLQNRDRVAAASQALQVDCQQVLILDDAFQHRRLFRDLDIVLLDALEPFGYEHLLPRGLLREPLEGLARAHVVALSRSDAVPESRRREIEGRVRALAPHAVWIELAHRPIGLVSFSRRSLDLAAIAEWPIAAFCGIGNPAGFRHTLASSAKRISGFMELPDHCPYDQRQLSRLTRWLQTLPDVEHAVCTCKDLVKIPHDKLGGKHLWALDVELQIVRGQAELEALLSEVVAQASSLAPSTSGGASQTHPPRPHRSSLSRPSGR